MKIVVLGGAGSMGRITVRDLCETWLGPAGREVLIADRDFERARSAVDEVRSQCGGKVHARNLSAARVDIRDAAAARKTIGSAGVVINCLQYQLNLEAMELALALGAHYVDLGGLFHMTRRQLTLNARFQKAELTAVLGMGAAPGITNLLAAQGAERFEQLTEIHARVASWDGSRYEPKPALAVAYSLQTILEEFSFEPAVFTRGDWTFVSPMSGDQPHRFPAPIGLRKPMYTLHSEVATLPVSFASKGVRECSFKIAFDPEFTERVRFLRDLGLASHEAIELPSGGKAVPVEVVNRVALSQPIPRRVGPLRQAEVVRVILKGWMGKKKRTLVLDLTTRGLPEWGLGLDVDTGCPPSIVAQMLVAGDLTQTGVVAPELAVPWRPFFAALRKRKMRVQVTEKAGWSFST